MALCADNAQATGVEGLRFQLINFGANGVAFFIIITGFLGKAHIEIAAKLNIRAATGHIGGDGDGARHTGLRDDLGFLLVIARVQNTVLNLFGFQRGGQFLGFINRCCADQNRLVFFLAGSHKLDNGRGFFCRCAINRIIFIKPRNIRIGRNFDHVETVNIHKLIGLGQRRAGHAR